MDLESIKVLADTATQLTGEAKQVFVWWLLGKEILGSLLTFVFFLTIVILGYRLIRAHIKQALRKATSKESVTSLALATPEF